MNCMDWILYGILIVVITQIAYAIIGIWEIQYGNLIGLIFILIGVIKLGKYFKELDENES